MGRGWLLVACGGWVTCFDFTCTWVRRTFLWHVGTGGFVRCYIVMVRSGLFVACKDPGTILGMDPVWPQKALPRLKLHCRSHDFGAPRLRGAGEAILGLGPVWPQNAIPLLRLYCGNDDFGALGLRRPREAMLGLEPVWPLNALPLLRLYYGNDDFGALELRRPPEAILGMDPVWPQRASSYKEEATERTQTTSD